MFVISIINSCQINCYIDINQGGGNYKYPFFCFGTLFIHFIYSITIINKLNPNLIKTSHNARPIAINKVSYVFYNIFVLVFNQRIDFFNF